MKTNNLVKIVGGIALGTAVILGGTYYLRGPYAQENFTQKDSQELNAAMQVPGKVLDIVGESFEQGLKEFAKDYKAHPEKYDNLMDKEDPKGENLNTCLKIFLENYKK